MKKTILNSKKNLIIYLNYSGKDDIFNSLKSLQSLKIINKNKINSYLSSSGIPDPDILIRTGGFKRISDFMLYQISFTELFFKNKLWPDISKNDIKKIIEQFNRIDRKFGNLPEESDHDASLIHFCANRKRNLIKTIKAL